MLLITHLCSESRVCSAEHDASRTRLLYLLLNSPSTVTSIARRIRRAFLLHAFFHLSWRGTVRKSAPSFQNLRRATLLGAEKSTDIDRSQFCRELQVTAFVLLQVDDRVRSPGTSRCLTATTMSLSISPSSPEEPVTLWVINNINFKTFITYWYLTYCRCSLSKHWTSL